MKIQFNQEITTTVPTCMLIENYQDLVWAIRNKDWDLVQVVADCLTDTITDYTTVPESLDIKPSGSSLIAMSCESGIILDENGRDIKCVAGRAVSEAMCGDCCQCDETCQFMHGCSPERGLIRLGKAPNEMFDAAKQEQSLAMLEKLGEKTENCQGQ